jgi:tetratricopeptide (TPR) repeat protein
VILYELLADRLPHDVAERPLHEAVRRICEEPHRPLRGAATTTTGRIDANVDTVVRKCLEKDPDRRYGSAAELLEDLERCLADQPVLAKPPSTVYQLRLFTRRHRVLCAAVGAIFVVLLGASIVSTAMYLRAQAARREAVSSRDNAVQEASKARAVTEFLQTMLASANPNLTKGREVTVREVLDRSAQRIETGFRDQPLVEAAIRETMGRTYFMIGAYDESERHYRSALSLRTRELGPDDIELATALLGLGELLTAKGERTEAAGVLRQASELCRNALGAEDPQTLKALQGLGYVLWGRGEYAESERLHRQVFELRVKMLGKNQSETLWSQHYLAMVLRDTGRLREAEALFRDGLATSREALGDEEHLTIHYTNQLGEMLARQDRLDEAEPFVERALALRQRIFGDDNKWTTESLLSLSDLRRREGLGPRSDPHRGWTRGGLPRRGNEGELHARRLARARRDPGRTRDRAPAVHDHERGAESGAGVQDRGVLGTTKADAPKKKGASVEAPPSSPMRVASSGCDVRRRSHLRHRSRLRHRRRSAPWPR